MWMVFVRGKSRNLRTGIAVQTHYVRIKAHTSLI